MEFNPKNLIVITGPSGVGKTTIALSLINKYPDIKRLITYTTREIRKEEKADYDYHFVSEEKFRQMIKNHELFEWAKVYDHYYGNRLSDLEKLSRENKFVLMVLDIQGAHFIKRKFKNANVIFVTANKRDLIKRILERGGIGGTDLRARKKKIKDELDEEKKFDYRIKNKQGEVEKAIEKAEKILKKIEKKM